MFAYPKGRPRKDGNQAKGGIQLPSSDDVETSIFKIRRDKLIPDSSEWMVLLSFATDEMIRYMSMYPQVWFMDCTAGMFVILFEQIIFNFILRRHCASKYDYHPVVSKVGI